MVLRSLAEHTHNNGQCSLQPLWSKHKDGSWGGVGSSVEVVGGTGWVAGGRGGRYRCCLHVCHLKCVH